MSERATPAGGADEDPQVSPVSEGRPAEAGGRDPAAGGTPTGTMRNATKNSQLDKALIRLRSTRAGRFGVRLTIGIIGAIVTGIGLVLVPLPGPGWLIVFAGLAILSIEFTWARRLRRFGQDLVGRWGSWYARQGWITKIVVGAATFLFVLGIIVLVARITWGASMFNWLHHIGL